MPRPAQPPPPQAPAPRRGRARLSRRHALHIARHRPVWQHWREPCQLAHATAWPAFLGLIATGCLALNLIFAELSRLEPTGLGSLRGHRTSPAEAFVFSVPTLAAIGFGSLHPPTQDGSPRRMTQELVIVLVTS